MWRDNPPNLSSPKLPHPIFLPTLKFGPTIRTPDDEVDVVELLLWRPPGPPPTAELEDCMVPTANAASNIHQSKQSEDKESRLLEYAEWMKQTFDSPLLVFAAREAALAAPELKPSPAAGTDTAAPAIAVLLPPR